MFDGQSNMIAPIGGTGTQSVPFLTAAQLAADNTFTVIAIPGTTFAERAVDAFSRADELAGNAETTLISIEGGPSEFIEEDRSASYILDAAETYADNRRAAGFDYVIGATIPPSTSYDAGMETERLSFNNTLRNGVAWLDAVIDVASIPQLANPADTTYYSDGLHFTSAATALVAAAYATVIDSLLT